jgi:hypothetical protein
VRPTPRGSPPCPRMPAPAAKTKVITCGTEMTINAFYRHSRIKQYLKDGRALRIETVINSPTDLRIGRRLHNLGDLHDAARAINTRLLHTERAGRSCVLGNPVFERIARPVGHRRRAESYSHALWRLSGPGSGRHLVPDRGRRHRHHQQESARPDDRTAGTPYTMNQASYDLVWLARNGLITRWPHANTYGLTPDRLKFAIFYTKVRDRVLAPLFTAGQPSAPPQLRDAMRTIEQHIVQRLADARPPSAT